MLKISQYDTVTLFYMGRSVLGFLLYPVHAFGVGGTLIDTGTNRSGREFLSALRKGKVSRVINTHHHEDHVGNNADVQAMFGAPIFAHALALPYLEDPKRNALRLYQRIVWDWPKPCRGTEIGSSVDGGDYHFDVFHTPGHTDDHLCLYEPRRRWLFTGDLFCGTNFIYLRRDENYLQILATLKKLSALKVETIFCNLKGAVPNGRKALLKKIARMEQLRDDVLMLGEKGLPPDKIREKVLGKDDTWRWITQGHYSKQNTVDSILHAKRPDQIR